MNIYSVRKLTPMRLFYAIRRRLSPFNKLVRSGRVVIGIGSYGTPTVRIYDGDQSTRLLIGNYCSIASSATFLLGGNHPTNRASTFPIRLRLQADNTYSDGFPSSKGDIVLGHDVWIGHDALVLSGVTIGNGAVIAAGSVVTRSVDPYTIVAGNPARKIRFRIDPEAAAKVEATEWWNWPPDEVVKNVERLNGMTAGDAF